MHVWDVTLAIGTTQQPVQRPVCIITACPAAQDRQTRLRAPSCKTQTSHPIAKTPGGPGLGPAQRCDSENGQTNAYKHTKWQTQGEKFCPEKMKGWLHNQKQSISSFFFFLVLTVQKSCRFSVSFSQWASLAHSSDMCLVGCRSFCD